MTKLEKQIYDFAIDRIPDMAESIKDHKYEGLVHYPFVFCGCMSSVVFDLNNKVAKPLYVEYRYGVGKGEYLLGGSTAMFDKFEIKRIPINL